MNDRGEQKQKDIGLGSLAVIGSGYGAKKLLDMGYIDGRTTLYHGTSEAAAKRIKEEGLKGKYTGVGSKEADAITKQLANDVLNQSKGKVFLDRSRWGAANYAIQHKGDRKRIVDHFNIDWKGLFEHLTGVKKGIVKARVPLHMKTTIRNPEARSSYEEFKKKLPIDAVLVPEHQKKLYTNIF